MSNELFFKKPVNSTDFSGSFGANPFKVLYPVAIIIGIGGAVQAIKAGFYAPEVRSWKPLPKESDDLFVRPIRNRVEELHPISPVFGGKSIAVRVRQSVPSNHPSESVILEEVIHRFPKIGPAAINNGTEAYGTRKLNHW
jgi:hypothetical protein